jgi:hypothetical protein
MARFQLCRKDGESILALAAEGQQTCFLKYLWWTACYSAWYGIPKMADQWRAAGTRASFNGWSVIALEVASIAAVFTILQSRSSRPSDFLRAAPRLILSLVITIAVTALFALALAWIKQGSQ